MYMHISTYAFIREYIYSSLSICIQAFAISTMCVYIYIYMLSIYVYIFIYDMYIF